jgi:8-oxo-dGTP pyrophosphatase MutT (NUDIX family)
MARMWAQADAHPPFLPSRLVTGLYRKSDFALPTPAGYHGDMIDESWYVRPPEGVTDRTSAGGVVARRGDDGRVLVALSRLGGGGDCFLPKGGVEEGETLEQAARREIAEEVGITDLTLLAPLGSRSRLNWNRKRWITTHYFLFRTGQAEGRPTDDAHDYRLVWAPLDDLPPIYWPEQRRLVEESRETILRLLNTPA